MNHPVGAFIEPSHTERPEVDRPKPVLGWEEPDALPHEDTREIDVLAAPPKSAAGEDVSHDMRRRVVDLWSRAGNARRDAV